MSQLVRDRRGWLLGPGLEGQLQGTKEAMNVVEFVHPHFGSKAYGSPLSKGVSQDEDVGFTKF